MFILVIQSMNIVNAEEATAGEQAPAETAPTEQTTTEPIVEKPKVKEHIKAKIIEAGKSYERENSTGGKNLLKM